MSFRTLTVDELCVSPFNVRSNHHDANAVAGMAESLLTRGQLYPLVVHPMPRKGRQKQIWGALAGGRRYRAFRQLVDQGRLPADTPIEVIVREGITEGELREISLAENLVRLDLRPYERFAAVASALAKGRTIRDIADGTGQSQRAIAQWARLGNLEPTIFQALEEERISEAQAMAFAATEDHALQLHAFAIFQGWSAYDRKADYSVGAIRRLLKIGDREQARLLRFVSEKAYADAGGRYELDLFADAAEHRGRVVDEGLLVQLADAKLEAARETLRAQLRRTEPTRDLRFEVEYPRDGNYGGTAHDLEITPAWGGLPSDKAERLEYIANEMAELEHRADKLLDQPDTPERAAAIAEIDTVYVPLELEFAALEAEQALTLPAGDLFATLIIQEDGLLETRFWWASRKAMRAAQGLEGANRTLINTPADRTAQIRDGDALKDKYSPAAKQAAAVVKEDQGLSQAGLEIMRSIRRELLRAALVNDADHGMRGETAQDYLLWNLARDALMRDSYAQDRGMKGLALSWQGGPPPEAAEHVERTEAHRIWQSAVDELKAHPAMAQADLVAAFAAWCDEDAFWKRKAAAVVAGLALERSAEADGYRIPLHDFVASRAGAADPALLHSWCEPTEELLDLLPRAQRLELVRPHVTATVFRAWEKMKARDLSAPIARTLAGVRDWIHPILRFRSSTAVPGDPEARDSGSLAAVFEEAAQ